MSKKHLISYLAPALLLGVWGSVPLRAQLSPGAPCLVPGPGYSCVGYVTFSSYFKNGPFKPFQATPGTGAQPDITINFNPPVYEWRALVNDPDYPARAHWYSQNIGYVSYLQFPGDGIPGLFSFGGGGIQNARAYRLILQTDSRDYANWYVEYRPASSSTFWCRLNAQTTSCGGVTATASSWSQNTAFDPFQAVDNYSGVQAPIEVDFQYPLYSVSVTAVDPDYPGNRMDAYGADGMLLGSVSFTGDNKPGFFTMDTKSITDSRGITKIVLVNDPNDYVAWTGLTATPGY
ncbi:MAG: hypothetical protein ACJ76N_02260 [Thermoanaerobaculia bacterium]